ncbi:MAG: hypothetical protein A2Y10_01580 [Planctomycetes bacterium GWF2_41_51]|nr:MAG: hypothetical protein A2Y10_01580 [Planctomycetes bacterium GWF2_41_51]HBG27049.1 hypothetical protein [Phycisphaerales bacterium]
MPSTESRVIEHTDEAFNEKFWRDIEARIQYYSARIESIQQRLDELECEWDIERVLETQASSLILIGLFFGATVSRKWFMLPALVSGFFLQHALMGWCPPVPVFRRLGVRTTREINQERYALKALKGDFDEVNSKSDEHPLGKAEKALRAAKIC